MTKSSAPSNKELAEKLKRALNYNFELGAYISGPVDETAIREVIKSLESSAPELEELRKRDFKCFVCGSMFSVIPDTSLQYPANVFCPLCSSFIIEIDEVRKRE